MSDATDDTNSNGTQNDRAREPEGRAGALGSFLLDVVLTPVFEILGMLLLGAFRLAVHLVLAVFGAIASIFSW